MKYVWLALLVVVTVVLQTSFFGEVRLAGIVPNLFLVLVIYIGLSLRANEAMTLALAGGILLDFASGADFGLRMAFYSALALGVMLLAETGADLDNLSVVLILTAGATVLYNLAVIASLATIHVQLNWWHMVTVVLLEVLVNMAVALLVRPLLVRILRRPSSMSAVALRNGGQL